MQYVMTLSPGSPTQLWYFPTNDLCGSFKDFLSELLAANATAARLVPSVHSISYGLQGNITGLGCTVDQISSTDADFAKAAARGFTIIIASGDSGAAVDSGNCMGGPVHNNTQLHGTTSAEHQLIDSYVTCCSLADGMPWTFVGPEFGPGSGVCQVYSAVTGSAPVGDSGTISSASDISPRVWTSYPSSSP